MVLTEKLLTVALNMIYEQNLFSFFFETGSVILTLNGTDGKIAHSSVKYDCCTYSKMKLKILSCSSILSILNYEVISRRVLFMNVAL